ncbi:MAG: ketoacyl-ACP synthase III [Pseudomonadota bacterium]
MSRCQVSGSQIRAIATCVPALEVENASLAANGFTAAEIRKVSALAGVRARRVVEPTQCASDLCVQAARQLLHKLTIDPASIDAVIFVTQSPDYFLPSTACVVHDQLGLPHTVAAFDVGLGCSGYPYGLYLAATMIRGGGMARVLLLHGETPSRFTSAEDRSTHLLFGDAGSATLIDADDAVEASSFVLHTDGSGARDLIIPGGGFRDPRPEDPRDYHVRMDGTGIFNFTLKRVPALINDTLALHGLGVGDVDHYVFHQSNQFIMKHMIKKCELTAHQAPLCLEKFGNTGGVSVPLTVTQCLGNALASGVKRLMFLGYGVGLSWGSALMSLEAPALLHSEYR